MRRQGAGNRAAITKGPPYPDGRPSSDWPEPLLGATSSHQQPCPKPFPPPIQRTEAQSPAESAHRNPKS
jgi:hypothetical protein